MKIVFKVCCAPDLSQNNFTTKLTSTSSTTLGWPDVHRPAVEVTSSSTTQWVARTDAPSTRKPTKKMSKWFEKNRTRNCTKCFGNPIFADFGLECNSWLFFGLVILFVWCRRVREASERGDEERRVDVQQGSLVVGGSSKFSSSHCLYSRHSMAVS